MRLVPSVLALLAAVALPAAAQGPVTADPAARTSLALTVYQADFALVEDVRGVALANGGTVVHLPGVSEAMIAASAQVLPSGAGAGFTVRTLGLGGAVAGTESLLRAHEGQEITVLRILDNGQEVRQRARILRASPEVIAEIDGAIHVGLPGRPVFDTLPQGLPLNPGLTATLDGTRAGAAPVALRYLTRGMSWTADHVLTLAPGRAAADLTTWATLRNGTRQSWQSAKLAVVAGEVNLPDGRHEPMPTMMARAAPAPMMEKAADSGMAREATDGVHVYRLAAPIDLAAEETRQVRLLGASALPIETVYEDEGPQYVYYDRHAGERRTHPATKLVLRNAANGPLGAPLPAGPIRVYAADAGGQARFVGGAHLPPVPVGEEARVEIGRAFDLTVERTQTSFKRLSETVVETAHKIIVRNGGAQATTVRIIEPMPGDWEIIASSQPHEKRDSARALWPVKVAAGGTTELTFTVRTTF
ncbi:MAG: DUF4139 domain-containing protein [Rhodospirillaceae bacterium]